MDLPGRPFIQFPGCCWSWSGNWSGSRGNMDNPMYFTGPPGVIPPPYFFQGPFLDPGFGPGNFGHDYNQQQFQLPPQGMAPVVPCYWPMDPQVQCQPSIRMEATPQIFIPAEVVIGAESGYGGGPTPNMEVRLRSKQRRRRPTTGGCRFCMASGETEEVWKSHVVREDGIVVCPILRGYVCPICKAEGDDAHTIRYCPKNETNERGHFHIRYGHNAAGKIIGDPKARPRYQFKSHF